jgi:DNA-binding GntR family transcriptional regulator
MPLQQIELPGERSRAQELYDYLRDAIVSGELKPRERLVESHVAQLAAVSRTPVREALHRLEVDGLVQESDRGVEVCGFTMDEMADLCAVRETLEGMAASLAAVSRSDVDLVMLRKILAADAASDGDRDATDAQIRLNHSFHETIWHASRNRYLAAELRSLRHLIERLQDTTLRSPERRLEALAEHRELLDAIERRDGVEAERLARLHFHHATIARLTMASEHTPLLAQP